MTTDQQHEELLKLLNPLVDYMRESGVTYLLVAGKNGICTRHMQGNASDLEGMLFGLAKKNKSVAAVMRNVANDIKTGIKNG